MVCLQSGQIHVFDGRSKPDLPVLGHTSIFRGECACFLQEKLIRVTAIDGAKGVEDGFCQVKSSLIVGNRCNRASVGRLADTKHRHQLSVMCFLILLLVMMIADAENKDEQACHDDS